MGSLPRCAAQQLARQLRWYSVVESRVQAGHAPETQAEPAGL